VNDRTTEQEEQAARLDYLHAQVADKREAVQRSHAAINHCPALLVSSLNGETVTESGQRLSVADVTKGVDAIRAMHVLLTNELAELEKALRAERSRNPPRGKELMDTVEALSAGKRKR